MSKKFGKIFLVLSLIASLILSYMIGSNRVFPTKYRIIFIGFLFIFEIILYLLLKKNEVGTLVAFFILGFFSIVINSFSSYYIYSGVNALDNINKKQETEEIKSSLVVLKDSKYESIEDIRDELVETALKQDEKN